MTASWPEALPQYFEAAGFVEGLAAANMETPTDYGPGKNRRLFTANWRQISGVIRCTADQVETFEGFFDETVKGGTLDFLWRAPLSQRPAIMRFRGQKPKAQYAGGDHFLVQLHLFQKAMLTAFRFDSTEVTFDSLLDSFDDANTY